MNVASVGSGQSTAEVNPETVNHSPNDAKTPNSPKDAEPPKMKQKDPAANSPAETKSYYEALFSP